MNKNYTNLQSRRQFLGVFAAAIPLLSFGKTEPEIILYNGNIFTVNPKEPTAQAVAIAGGRLMAVGSNTDILKMATGRTRKIDLEYKTVLPGFIDAHTHPAYSGIHHLKMVDCDLRSIKDIKEAISKRAAITPKGNWVEGFKYDDTKTSEGRKITLIDLDEAAPEHPVRITHRGGHTNYCNSLAFKMAMVDESTPNPKGGEFEKTPDGKLTGCVKEAANNMFDKLIPNLFTRDEMREAVKLISKNEFDDHEERQVGKLVQKKVAHAGERSPKQRIDRPHLPVTRRQVERDRRGSEQQPRRDERQPPAPGPFPPPCRPPASRAQSRTR